MASYQVLPGTTAFQTIGAGAGRGLGEMTGSYFDSAQKKREKEEDLARKQEQINLYSKAVQDGDMQLSKLNYDSEGKGQYTYVPRETPEPLMSKNPKEAIMRAMLGLGGEKEAGQVLGVPQPEPINPQQAQDVFPMMSMTGETNNISKTGGPMDYGQAVQQALQSRFAPGMDTSTISRDYLGLPQPKTESESAPKYEDMIRRAVSGEVPYEAVRNQFPSKYKDTADIQSEFSPKIEMSPNFKEGGSSAFDLIKSYFSKNQATLTPETKKVIANIKNQGDLDELLQKRVEYEEAGVDVRAIMEYYGVKE